MAHKYYFEALDKTLKGVMCSYNNSDEVFGRKVVVFCGDFRQILLVVSRGVDMILYTLPSMDHIHGTMYMS